MAAHRCTGCTSDCRVLTLTLFEVPIVQFYLLSLSNYKNYSRFVSFIDGNICHLRKLMILAIDCLLRFYLTIGRFSTAYVGLAPLCHTTVSLSDGLYGGGHLINCSCTLKTLILPKILNFHRVFKQQILENRLALQIFSIKFNLSRSTHQR